MVPVDAGTPWAAGSAATVRSLLAGRWWNLWRLTDPLGFQVDVPPTQPNTSMDRPAEEFDTSTYVVGVDGHGNYPRSLTYLAVLLEALPPNLRRAATTDGAHTQRSHA